MQRTRPGHAAIALVVLAVALGGTLHAQTGAVDIEDGTGWYCRDDSLIFSCEQAYAWGPSVPHDGGSPGAYLLMQRNDVFSALPAGEHPTIHSSFQFLNRRATYSFRQHDAVEGLRISMDARAEVDSDCSCQVFVYLRPFIMQGYSGWNTAELDQATAPFFAWSTLGGFGVWSSRQGTLRPELTVPRYAIDLSQGADDVTLGFIVETTITRPTGDPGNTFHVHFRLGVDNVRLEPIPQTGPPRANFSVTGLLPYIAGGATPAVTEFPPDFTADVGVVLEGASGSGSVRLVPIEGDVSPAVPGGGVVSFPPRSRVARLHFHAQPGDPNYQENGALFQVGLDRASGVAIGDRNKLVVAAVDAAKLSQDCVVEAFKVLACAVGLYPDPEQCHGSTAARSAISGDRLAILRAFRDQTLRSTAAGRYYANLYERLSPALIEALVAKPTLLPEIVAAEDDWIAALQALTTGSGSTARISSAMATNLRQILDHFKAAGSESLARTIDREQARLGLDDLTGMSAADLWQRVNEQGGPATCVPSPAALCLNGGRFRVETEWVTTNGERGAGHAVPLGADSGYFWFFDPANVESVVKVLDGCGQNGRYWAFAAGLTNVRVVTTVTDTWTGVGKSYVNPTGTAFAPIQDTSAVDVCAAAAPAGWKPLPAPRRRPAVDAIAATAAGCVPSATQLCLGGGRFRVEVDWRRSNGETGAGHAVGLTGDTGTFWFFTPTNTEAIVKVIDGCALNGKHWVFAGGLTDVKVTLRVTDTSSGETRTYVNPQGVAFRPIQDTDALGSCS